MSEQEMDAPQMIAEEPNMINENDEKEGETCDIEFDIRQLNFDHLRRKHAYVSGANI